MGQGVAQCERVVGGARHGQRLLEVRAGLVARCGRQDDRPRREQERYSRRHLDPARVRHHVVNQRARLGKGAVVEQPVDLQPLQRQAVAFRTQAALRQCLDLLPQLGGLPQVPARQHPHPDVAESAQQRARRLSTAADPLDHDLKVRLLAVEPTHQQVLRAEPVVGRLEDVEDVPMETAERVVRLLQSRGRESADRIEQLEPTLTVGPLRRAHHAAVHQSGQILNHVGVVGPTDRHNAVDGERGREH